VTAEDSHRSGETGTEHSSVPPVGNLKDGRERKEVKDEQKTHDKWNHQGGTVSMSHLSQVVEHRT